MKIDPYIHLCVIKTGDLAGNTYREEVYPYQYEYGERCTNCRQPLVDTETLVAHIYSELLNNTDS